MDELDDKELELPSVEEYLLMSEEEKDLELEKTIRRIRIANRRIIEYELQNGKETSN